MAACGKIQTPPGYADTICTK